MTTLLPEYAELHCISNFSFLRGASHPEELVAEAHAKGYRALALTDECSFAGVVRAHMAARQINRSLQQAYEAAFQAAANAGRNPDHVPEPRYLKLIIGAEFHLQEGMHVVLLAQTRKGYGHLSAFITQGRRNALKGEYRLHLSDLDKGLPDCVALLIPRHDELDQHHAERLAQRFSGNAYIATELLLGPNDRAALENLRVLSQRCGLPLVAAGDVHMTTREQQVLQDTLTAIRLGIKIHECGHALFPNAERHLRLRAELANIYPPDVLARTIEIAERCQFNLEELKYEYPDEIVSPGETVRTHLHKEVERGLKRRYPEGTPQKVQTLIEHELDIIAKKNYEPYFLTVYDIVNFARGKKILCQGRGSSANSAVCYALGITAIDPARMNMLFERFISMARNEPPDIDVDFEHDRREEVIQYIYAKYGRDRAALAATVIRYRVRSAIRDVGKALGYNAEQVDELAKSLAWWDQKEVLFERFQKIGIDPGSLRARQFFALSAAIRGFPRHLSQHVGGFVIARGLLSHLVPIENASMQDRCVIQWEKDDLEAIGLMKVDVLALGMLSVIRRSFENIKTAYGIDWNMTTVPPKDEQVFAMIQRADTVGVFQIESRAQMSMLPRLRPENYYDLVVQIAIVRPGPIQGDMVHPYLVARERRRNGEKIEMEYPQLEPVLGRTLGVPIFQEQVMQLVMTAAGFSADRADELRRSMASWQKKGGLDKFEAELMAGMKKHGYSETFAQKIWKQICGFGEYGFPESHSASFALLAYVSAWLKFHYPVAFLAGLLNSQPMGFYTPSQLVQDAQRHDVEVRPVDVCRSDWDCVLEPSSKNFALRLGLRMVKGLSQSGAFRLVDARKTRAFSDLNDLAYRAELQQPDLQALAKADACKEFDASRREALWTVAGIDHTRPLLRGLPSMQSPVSMPPLSEAENIWADYAQLGLSLGRHPLALLRPRLQRMQVLSAQDLHNRAQNEYVAITGLVT
ncbi:MAG TPA: error-prone DNA polymerase, partial [Burkholderiales bacterium]|nr:error-prone DNA polymerase [Burkholderiales bacterium]